MLLMILSQMTKVFYAMRFVYFQDEIDDCVLDGMIWLLIGRRKKTIKMN